MKESKPVFRLIDEDEKRRGRKMTKCKYYSRTKKDEKNGIKEKCKMLNALFGKIVNSTRDMTF